MKAIALLLSATSIAIAQEAVPMKPITPKVADAPAAKAEAPAEPTVKEGSMLTPEVFGKLEWVQGEVLKEWEPGKIYVIECWATWCGPCIAAIPHVNELHKKYHEKGLRVYGINVWEDGKDKVETFVKKKGEGMVYPVAYTGKGGAFETEWLKPAGVTGIPHTFVLRDGKLLLKAHPSSLTDEVIEALLSGEEGAKQAIAKLEEAKAKTAKYYETIRAFSVASRAKNTDEMAARLAEMKELGGDDPRISGFEIELAVARKDWAAAEKLLAEVPESAMKAMTIQQSARVIADAPEVPESLLRAVATAYQPVAEKLGGPTDFQQLATLQWKLGDKQAAIASIKSAGAKAADERYAKAGFSAEPYEKIAASMEQGVFPEKETIGTWFREAYEKRKAQAPKTEGS